VKIVSNKTRKPLKIALAGGKFLHLGPLKTGQIADHESDRPAIKKLIEAGEIEILGEGAHGQEGAETGAAPHEDRHGHPQNTMQRPKGNR
jgi:hypothetical protein